MQQRPPIRAAGGAFEVVDREHLHGWPTPDFLLPTAGHRHAEVGDC